MRKLHGIGARRCTALRGWALSAAIVISLAAVAPANAAESAGTAADSTAAAGGLEEIVVTAQRREESEQKVPIAITVLSTADIQKKNIADFHDLNRAVPGLNVNNAGSDRDSLNFVIRGLGVASNSGSDPAVLVYFADVPAITEGPGAIYDLANVQVLKGPQGTLFGRNTTGGAILLEPVQPGDKFGGYLDVSAGDYDLKRAQGALNVPVVNDMLLMRLAFDVNRRDGFTTNIQNGQDLDNVDYSSFRLSTTFKPTADLQDRLILDYTHNTDNGAGLVIGNVNPNNGFALAFKGVPALQPLAPAFFNLFSAQQARGPREVNYGTPSYNNFVTYDITNTLSYALSPNITLKNIFGYRVYKDRVAQDVLDLSAKFPILAILPSPYLDTGTFGPQSQTAITDEQQIQGSALNDRLTWIFGGFYGDTKPYTDSQRYWLAALNPAPLVYIQQSLQTTKALYAQADYGITDKLKVSVGGRYTWDGRSYRFGNYQGAVGTGALVTCRLAAAIRNPACLYVASADFRAPTGNIDLTYQLNPSVMLYATARRGYRSGGFAPAPLTAGTTVFKPEFDNDYEAGVKSNFTWAGVEWRVNFSLFDSFVRDLQESSPTFDTTSGAILSTTVNAGRANYRGTELEMTVVPVRNLKLGGYWEYLDPRYTSNLIQTLPPPAPPTDLSHAPFQNAPRNKVDFNAEYTINLPSAAGDLVLMADWAYQSRVYFLEPLVVALTNPDRGQRAYGLLNARIDWRNIWGESLDAGFFVTNATNQLYKVHESDQYNGSTGFSQIVYGAPRMFGGEVKYRF
jgi:iron complex outermembrane recepter protein